MAKTRSKSSRFSLFQILLVLLIAACLLWETYRLYPRESASIFLVSEAPVYGEVTLSGIIQQNSAGTFFLYPALGSPIELAIEDVEPLVGYLVTVKGVLSPPTATSPESILTISEVSANDYEKN